MKFPILLETYRAALPDAEKEHAERLVAAAVAQASGKHRDWGRFEPAIEHLSRLIFCNHAHVPLAVYLETLYCAVKHGDFSKAWRGELKRPAAAASAQR